MKSSRKTSSLSNLNCYEECRRSKDFGGLISITAWLNFFLTFVYWLKIDFLNYWISRPLHWWEKRESAFSLTCFIFCAACIHTVVFARERLINKRAPHLREFQSEMASAETLLDRAIEGEDKGQGERGALPNLGYDQRNVRG
jgi:hypothetical protein